MNDLSAAIGLGNMEDFPEKLKRRIEIGGIYREEFKDIPGLQLLEYKDDRESAYWLFTMLVERRTDFIRKLKEKEIPASVMHQRIDNNSVFGGTRRDLRVQDKFDEDQVSIPVHSALTEEDVVLIVDTIKKGW